MVRLPNAANFKDMEDRFFAQDHFEQKEFL